MYIFNVELFKNLYAVLGITRKELLAAINVTATTYDYWYQNSDVTFMRLIDMCNILHIPVSHFVLPKPTEPLEIGKREDYVIRAEEWKPITVDTGLLADDATTKYKSVKGACAVLNCSTRTISFSLRKNNKGMMLSTFLSYINKGQFYPGDYVLDENRPIIIDDGVESRVDRQSTLEINKINRRARNLEIENKRLHTQLAELERRLAAMAEQSVYGTPRAAEPEPTD